MARYIDVDKAITAINNEMFMNESTKSLFRMVLRAIPTADVVPRSEVEEWASKCRDWHEVAELKSQHIVELESTINRQMAEIERLKYNLKAVLEERAGHSEAIKEFAERLATKIVNTPFGVNCSGETESYKDGCLHGLVAKQNNILDMIYDLVKEMTEGK
jgi:hypothetical protein